MSDNNFGNGLIWVTFANEGLKCIHDLRWMIVLSIVLIFADFWWGWSESQMKYKAAKSDKERENFKENLQDAQVYEAYQQDNTKDKPKMTEKQYKEFTKVVEKYNKDFFAAIKEEMDKEVEVKYDKLTSDEFVSFCDSNDFTTTQALALSEVMSNME